MRTNYITSKIGKGIKFNYITSKNTLKNVSGIQNVIIYVGTVVVWHAGNKYKDQDVGKRGLSLRR